MRTRMRSPRRASNRPAPQFAAAVAAIDLPLRHPIPRPFSAPARVERPDPAPLATPTDEVDGEPDYGNPQWRMSHAGMRAKTKSSIWFALLVFGIPAALLVLAAALQPS